MAEDTSSGESVMPNAGLPATGTPATGGATPQPATPTVEELQRRIAELEHSHTNKTEELERHRKKLSSFEKAEAEREAAKKAAEEAQLSEIDRVKKQHAQEQEEKNALLMELQEIKIERAVERYAHELKFLHPEIAIRLLNRAELEYEDNGTPKNAKQLLEKIAKAMPELVIQPAPAPEASQPSASHTPTAPARTTPAIPAMNPGRTQIAQPGSNPPGSRPPRLSDVYKRP